MKKLLVLLLTAVLTAACRPGGSPKKEGGDGRPIITVTIEPLRRFAEAIAGDGYAVVTLVPKGSSPETYDPTPRQLLALSQSRACFLIGAAGFERAWADRLADNAPHLQFFDLSRGIETIADASCRHSHGGADPHVWNSPANVRIIAGNILSALCQMDKENEHAYLEHYDSLCRMLDHTDSLIYRMLSAPDADRAFMIYHPALTYFARDYGLCQIPIESGGKEPSPARLKELIDECREKQVRVVFVQPEFDRCHAALIARQVGVSIVPVNPLSYDWEDEMLNIARALAGSKVE